MAKEPTFTELHAAARAHQRPKFDAPDLVVNNSQGAKAPPTFIPTRAAPTLARSINQPKTPPPSDTFLEFDPNGSGQTVTAMLHPWTVWTAKKLGEEARSLTQRLFPDDPLHPGRRRNDEADAFRHAYWNYRMTQTFGPERARAFANAHEISTPNPIGERQMDLYNNKIGRDLAVGATGSPVDNVRRAIARDRTRNSPF
jgi:hypothetical protein